MPQRDARPKKTEREKDKQPSDAWMWAGVLEDPEDWSAVKPMLDALGLPMPTDEEPKGKRTKPR